MIVAFIGRRSTRQLKYRLYDALWPLLYYGMDMRVQIRAAQANRSLAKLGYKIVEVQVLR